MRIALTATAVALMLLAGPAIAQQQRASTLPSSLVGTWEGQAWQWPIKWVIQADDGGNVTLQWFGSETTAGQLVKATGAPVVTTPRSADGTFTVTSQRGNIVENARMTPDGLCGTFVQPQTRTRIPICFRKIG